MFCPLELVFIGRISSFFFISARADSAYRKGEPFLCHFCSILVN